MDNGHPPDPKRQRVHTQTWHRETQPTGPPSVQDREHIHAGASMNRQLPTPTSTHPKPHTPGLPAPGNPFANLVHHTTQEGPPPRRTSEHNAYESDSRRPSSGAHQFHSVVQNQSHGPSYGGIRDTMVKRDPSDEPQQVLYRQSPTNHSDHVLNPPHHDRPSHPGYDSGGPSPRSATQYRPPAYISHQPPHSPMNAHESFHSPGFPIHGPPTTQPPYGSVSYPANTVATAVKRKAQRASQACDSCRTLKAKCDEGRPTCQSCKEKGQNCVYRDPPPKQQDKAQSEMIESQQRVENMMVNIGNMAEQMHKQMIANNERTNEMSNNLHVFQTSLSAEISHLRSQVNALQKKAQFGELPAQPEEMPFTDTQTVVKTDPGNASFSPKVENIIASTTQNTHAPQSSFSSDPAIINSGPHPSYPSNESQQHILEPRADGSRGEDTEEEESGEPFTVKDPPSMPYYHTTGNARLLLVGPIKDLAKDIMASSRIKNGEKYPMMQETKRGLLRLYGRGEGLDRPPGYDREPMAEYASEGTPSDSNTDTPSPPGEEWGQLGGLTPPGDDHTPHIPRGNVINAEGMPNFSRETVLRLADNYKKHINSLHPILVPKDLDRLVEVFLKSIPENQAKSKPLMAVHHDRGPSAGFLGSNRYPESPGNKRKRSPVATGALDSSEVQVISEHKAGHPFRSITTAIVLLVMALGAVCEHQGKIPDVAPDGNGEDQFTGSPIFRNGQTSASLQSSPLVSTPVAFPSPPEADRMQPRSRRSSFEGTSVPNARRERPKNIDIIPGLSYFALATDIIGNQLAGSSLQHVHVSILAGLYHGQLGRILESHSYIFQACQVLQFILRPKLAKLRQIREKEELGEMVQARDNPLVIAFWTCLQLESDILAELGCIQSGLLRLENTIPHPNLPLAVKDGIDSGVMYHYSTQLFLRKHLNALSSQFYRPPSYDQDYPNPAIKDLKLSVDSMEAARKLFLTWEDGEPPATELLEARKRAKFYGARVITYRTFVLQILERNSAKSAKFGEGTILEKFRSSVGAPSVNSMARSMEELHPKVQEYIKMCLNALVQSTTAFHGLGDPGKDRIIVTNIWGTAHAQFGNMLTLIAAHQDTILTGIIPESKIRDLLEKTLRFLKFNALPSSALMTDFLVLQDIGRKTNLLPENWFRGGHGNPNSSFGSEGVMSAH